MKQLLLVPELRELLAARDIETIVSFCTESHPATVAELISGLDAAEIWQVLHMVGVKDRAEIFPHFDLDQQVELATGENRREMAALLEEMDPDERADLVQRLDEKVREEVLPLVDARMEFDPAVVASPGLTTIADITGLLIRFTAARFYLGI